MANQLDTYGGRYIHDGVDDPWAARLTAQLETSIQAGWFSDVDMLVVEALRCYLGTRPLELQEHSLRPDVEWGLWGRDRRMAGKLALRAKLALRRN